MKAVKFLLALTVMCTLFIRVFSEASAEESFIREEYQEYAREIAQDYGLDANILIAMIEAESSGRRKVVSSAGCIGLMQISPKWHADRMAELKVDDLEDAYGNILVGADYFTELYEKYEDIYTALMCYNEGEYSGAVERAERGEYSKYAEKIVARCQELDTNSEKTD